MGYPCRELKSPTKREVRNIIDSKSVPLKGGYVGYVSFQEGGHKFQVGIDPPYPLSSAPLRIVSLAQ